LRSSIGSRVVGIRIIGSIASCFMRWIMSMSGGRGVCGSCDASFQGRLGCLGGGCDGERLSLRTLSRIDTRSLGHWRRIHWSYQAIITSQCPELYQGSEEGSVTPKSWQVMSLEYRGSCRATQRVCR
jgi:hypothetical protein